MILTVILKLHVLLKRIKLRFFFHKCMINCQNFFWYKLSTTFKGIATNRGTHSNTLLACWKSSVYQDTVVKNYETSTYQELDLRENVYQNTTIR